MLLPYLELLSLISNYSYLIFDLLSLIIDYPYLTLPYLLYLDLTYL